MPSLAPRAQTEERRLPAIGRHVPALDGVRGIAILLVLLTHFNRLPQEAGEGWAGSFDYALFVILNFGWCGVDLFFVLSGFLITGILYKTKEGPRYFSNFYFRRTVRIFPLYYGFLAVLFLAPEWIIPAETEDIGDMYDRAGWYWLYGVNVLVAWLSEHSTPYALSHLWSLAVEEQFYLFWPPLVLLFSRKHLLWICGAFIVGALALRIAVLAAGYFPIAAYVLTPMRMDALAIGAFIALAARGERGAAPLLRWAKPAAMGAALVLAGLLAYYGRFYYLAPGVVTVGITALSVLFGALVLRTVVARPESWLSRSMSHPWLRFMGRISYAMYVVHMPIVFIFLHVGLDIDIFPRLFGSQLPGQLALLVLGTAITVLLSWLSWHLYEKHFLKLKELMAYNLGGNSDADEPPSANGQNGATPRAQKKKNLPASEG